jgi:hypothetical protein
MMTFLRFVCCELLGPPVYGSCWHCPKCDPAAESDWVSFSVRPPKKYHAIKFKCHRCHWWGDARDLLDHFFPDDPQQRRIMLADLERLYCRELRLAIAKTAAQRAEAEAEAAEATGDDTGTNAAQGPPAAGDGCAAGPSRSPNGAEHKPANGEPPRGSPGHLRRRLQEGEDRPAEPL